MERSLVKTKPSTEYALLGALMAGPKHGYEIMQFLSTALGSTWHIGTSQLYALLTGSITGLLIDF